MTRTTRTAADHEDREAAPGSPREQDHGGPEDGELRLRGTGEVAQAYRPTATAHRARMLDLG